MFTGVFNVFGTRRYLMNSDVFSGKWKQFRGEVKQRWGELTDDELDQIEGRRDKLIGKLQEKYGYSRSRAEEEVTRFLDDTEHRMGN
jgi:uncharacterized protein YjbJ (UPF0337 family)